ncbi:hypothetical protein ACFQ7I_40540, partial [Streptomyces massasporeus]
QPVGTLDAWLTHWSDEPDLQTMLVAGVGRSSLDGVAELARAVDVKAMTCGNATEPVVELG